MRRAPQTLKFKFTVQFTLSSQSTYLTSPLLFPQVHMGCTAPATKDFPDFCKQLTPHLLAFNRAQFSIQHVFQHITPLDLSSVDFSKLLMYNWTAPLSVFSYYFTKVYPLKDFTRQLTSVIMILDYERKSFLNFQDLRVETLSKQGIKKKLNRLLSIQTGVFNVSLLS